MPGGFIKPTCVGPHVMLSEQHNTQEHSVEFNDKKKKQHAYHKKTFANTTNDTSCEQAAMVGSGRT